MLTPTDLDRAVTDMTRHLRQGGVLLLEPWDAREDMHDGERVWVTTAEEPGRVVAMIETTELSGERVGPTGPLPDLDEGRRNPARNGTHTAWRLHTGGVRGLTSSRGPDSPL